MAPESDLAPDGPTRPPTGPQLAILGDIHANGPALDGVLAAIDRAGIAAGVCTGDVVMRGPDPGHCIDALAARGWPCAQGNTDLKVATRRPRPADHPKAQRVGSRSWTSAQLDAGQLAYLRELPVVARTDFAGIVVAAVHGTPESPSQAWDADTTDEELLALAERIGAQVVVSGHTHLPLVRRVGDRLFVNPGSVGEAMHADLFPRWARLERSPEGIRAHLERLELPLAVVRQPAEPTPPPAA